MLVNGIRSGEVTELYGYPCTGKTQFCYTFAINFVDNYKKRVIFFDTELTFSSKRFKQILDIRSDISLESRERVMSYSQVITLLDMSSILDTIETISYDLRTNSESQYKDLGLIIIDCLSTPLTIELKKSVFLAEVEEKERHNSSKANELRYRFIAMISQIANSLNSMALKHSIAVVVVNTQSLTLKRNWKNKCKLSLNFYDFQIYKGIKITRSYDKSIENKSYNKFIVGTKGFI